MLYYLTNFFDNFYYLYDSEHKEIKVCTTRQVKNIYAKGGFIDKYSKFENFIVAVHTAKRATFIKSQDVDFTYLDERPVFLIRQRVKIPKLPTDVCLFYKGLHIFIADSHINLNHHQYGATGKEILILPNRKTDTFIPKYMKGFYYNTEQEYADGLNEFFGCLPKDDEVHMYNIVVDTFGTSIDLTYFKKMYKIGKSLITPTYSVNTKHTTQYIKFNELMYIQKLNPIGHALTKLTFLDCTAISKKEWQTNITLKRTVFDFINGHLVPYGMVLFSKANTIITELLQTASNPEEQTVALISVGNVQRKSTEADTLNDLKRIQAKYALMKRGTKRVVLLVNLT